MKYIIHLLSIGLLLLGCNEKHQSIVISNTNDFDLSFKQLEVYKDQLNVVGSQLPIIKSQNGEFVPSQLIDIDKDGGWDKLIFQISMGANEKEELIIHWVKNNEYPAYDKQTQVYLGYSQSRDGNFVSVDQAKRSKEHVPQESPYTYQFEGPGWESNLVAFRSYFDTRNGKDIFGKTTEEMVTQKIGTGENYHTLQDWGMDVLKVGQSLGSGGLAILKNDSLLRLGETTSAEFIKAEDGPVYSSFKLTYKGWNVLGQEFEIQEKISIQANKRWFRSEVSCLSNESNEGDTLGDTLVVGIVNLKDAHVERIDHENMTTLFTHGIQSENKDALGMALLIPEEYFLSVAKAPIVGEGITNSELVYLTPQSNAYVYHFYAGWGLENSEFSKVENFRNRLKQEMQEFSAKLSIRVDE